MAADSDFKYAEQFEVSFLAFTQMIDNTELNDLRKIVCLTKSEVYVKKTNKKETRKKNIFIVIENLVEHGIHYLPCSYTNDIIDLSS